MKKNFKLSLLTTLFSLSTIPLFAFSGALPGAMTANTEAMGLGNVLIDVNGDKVYDANEAVFNYSWMTDEQLSYALAVNPSSIVNFKNQAFYEHAFVSGTSEKDWGWGGILFSPMKKLTIAITAGQTVDTTYWKTFDDGTFLASTATVASILDSAATMLPKVKESRAFLYGAYELSNKLNVGAFIGYASLGKTDSTNNQNYSTDGITTKTVDKEYAHQIDLGLGADYQLLNKLKLESSILFTQYYWGKKKTTKNEGNLVSGSLIESEDFYGSDNSFDLGINNRVNYQLGSHQTLHAIFNYKIMRSGQQLTFTNDIKDTASSNIDAKDTFLAFNHKIETGLSDEIKITKRVKAFVGLGATWFIQEEQTKEGIDNKNSANNVYSDKYNASRDKDMIFYMPIIVGAEAQLCDWAKVMFGVRQGLLARTYDINVDYQLNATGDGLNKDRVNKTNTMLNIENMPATTVNAGLALNFHGVEISWVNNLDLFTKGPSFVNGNTDNTGAMINDKLDWASKLAVTYNFDSLLNK